MTVQQCREQLKQHIIDTLHLEDITAADIHDDASLFGEEGLGLDSLDAVELVVMIEKHFGIVIENAEQARAAFASVTVLADYILTQKNTPNS